MQYSKLGSSGIEVSRVCLGTMTFGKQNTQADATEQLDYAYDVGVNFIDTAEMYAVPPSKETYGKTEVYIGNWIKNNTAKRTKTIVATKIAGRGLNYIRGGDLIRAEHIMPSVDASLKRLQTDYIDLYQLHWPNRPHPHFNRHWFGKLDFKGINTEQEEVEIVAVLEALNECVKVGKIRYCGLSNETPLGIEKYAQLSKKYSLPRMVSIQNEFSLIQNKDYPYVIEACAMNEVAYLPWSPLGSGVLSGKYLNGAMPEGSRWSFAGRHGNFRNQENVHKCVAQYAEIAKKHGMTASQLSLAWCNQFDWVTSTIIGATKMPQLKENIAAFEHPISPEAAAEVDAILRNFPVPYM